MINNTDRTEKHLDNWREYVYDKRMSELESVDEVKSENGDPKLIEHLEKNSAWSEKLNTDWIEQRIKTIEKIKATNI